MPRPSKYARLLASTRKNIEDRVEVFERDEGLVVVVADGAGGLLGGAVASDAAVAAVRSAVVDPAFEADHVQSWTNLLAGVDAQLARTMAGETTAIIAVIGPDGVVGASVGDSEAWVVTDTDVDDLTGGQKKKRLGSGAALPVSFFRPRLEGTLIAGTDGLFNYASMVKIAHAVLAHDEPAEAVEALRALVVLPSGSYHDDLGVVVVSPMGASRR